MKVFRRHKDAKDLREHGRVILAHGEATGHHHEILADPIESGGMSPLQYFEEPSGRRVLMIDRTCVLTHQEHARIVLDPARPVQARQGDVLLDPIGPGAWEVRRQREYSPEEIRNVAD